MKNWKLLLACSMVCAVTAWSQDQASPSSHVIDNDNIGSVTANSQIQDATAQQPAATTDADSQDKSEAAAQPKKEEEKPLSAKERLAKLKEKEESWNNTIDIAQKHIASAQNDNQRETWERNLELAQKGLTDNRAEQQKVQAEADQEESAPASGETSAQPAAPGEAPATQTQ